MRNEADDWATFERICKWLDDRWLAQLHHALGLDLRDGERDGDEQKVAFCRNRIRHIEEHFTRRGVTADKIGKLRG